MDDEKRRGNQSLTTKHLTMSWKRVVITHWGSARREELLTGEGRCPFSFFGKETFSCADFWVTSYLPLPLVLGQKRSSTRPEKAATCVCARPLLPPFPAGLVGVAALQDGGAREYAVFGEAEELA